MKKLLLPIILLISLTTLGQVPETGLAAEYKFTNGRLDNAVGENDLSIIGTSSVFENNRAAGPEKAILLNGDYLQRVNTSPFAVSASYWLKTSTNDANKRVIIDQTERSTDVEASDKTGWYTYLENGKVGVGGNFQWYHSNNTAAGATGYVGYQHLLSSASVDDNNWHHVTITMNARWYNWLNVQFQRFERIIECTYTLYVDGVAQGTLAQQKNVGSAPSPAMRRFTNSSSISITIGDIGSGTSASKYEDVFDDFRYYSKVLTAPEVGQLAGEAGCSGTSGVAAVTQDITIELDASGNASIVAADIDNGSNAVCDEPFTLSIDKTTFTCDDLGFNVVTLTATETFATQAVSTATATVTVTYVPEVITQLFTVQLDASGDATIVPNDVDNGSATTGLCGATLNFSLDITTFTCADLGSNTVTLTSDDGNGNIGSSTVTVVVEDMIAPVIIAQNIAVQVDANLGFVTITPAQVDNGSSDNCDSGALTMSLSKTKFTCEDTGDNIVTLTVEDTQGNATTADVTVTVTSAINDETITATNMSMCPDGSAGSTISTGSSVAGFNYTLRNSETNSIVNGPIAGTGAALDFPTGNLSETTTFNVLAEKALATTQSALDFDGINDYVNLGIDGRGIAAQVTAAAWIKTTGSGVAQIVVNKYNGVNGYHLIIGADGYAYVGGRDGAGYKQSGNSTTEVNDGEWHYLASSINISTGVWSIYVDGALENSAANGAGTTLASPATLTVGFYSTLFFTGEMDQVTIWNTELDAAAIQSNMNTCLAGSETNIVGHFIFEDGSGTTLTDQSSSALNGTLTNMDGPTDWVQAVSPSCGDKTCDYQLSTEISIGDVIAPIAIAQGITALIDANTGEVTITADMIDNGSTDNCTAVLTKSISKSTFSCGDAGDQIVTLTIEDESGNTSTAQATVTVTSPIVDETVTTASTGFCPDGSIATISTGGSVVGIDYYLRNSANNAIKDGPIAGTGSALDFSTGNISSTTTFNVYAKSTPLPAPHSALDFDGVNDKIVTTYAPPATSTLTVELWVYPRPQNYARILSNYGGSAGVLAGQIVMDTYSASLNGSGLRFFVSGAGNVQHFFGVEDVLSLSTWNHVAATFDNGIIQLYVDGVLVGTSSAASFTSLPSSTDNITIGEDRVQGPNAEYFDGQMDEVRIWNTARTESEIAAERNSCMMGNESGLELFYNFNENTGLGTTDLVNGNNGTLTDMDAGTDWVSSSVDISCGEVCDYQMTTEITIGDTTAPIAVAQGITIQLDASGNASIVATDVDNGSTDNCSSLNLSIDETAFTCADLGANTVTLTITDGSGNSATETAIVTVEDTTAPTIAAQNLTVQLDATGNATVDPGTINLTSSDNCSSNLIYALSQTAFDCSHVGANTLTFSVTDESGNTNTEDVIITIEEAAPTAITQDITVELGANGSLTISAADIDNGSSDDCTPVAELSLSLDVVDFTCEDIGVANQVTLTVTDLNGNASIETAIVTVVDLTLPTVVTQDIVLVLDESGNASIATSDLDNGSSDNCTSTNDLVKSLDKSTFDINDLGENTVTLSVADASGNLGTATATVTVSDKEIQTVTITGVADKTFGDEDFSISATADNNLAVAFTVVSGGLSITESAASSATFTITGTGQAVIQASNQGDATYAPLSETITIEIAKADQVLTVEEVANKSSEAGPTSIVATVNTGLDLEYIVSGPATISGNVVTLDGALGTVEVTVSQAGTDNYNPATGTISFDVVEKLGQTITFTQPSDVTYGAGAQTLVATADSNLPVNFTIVSGTAALSGDVLTFTKAGTIIIEATQDGNVDYVAAGAAQQTIIVSKAELDIVADDKTITFGDAIPALTFSYAGFVNEENEANLNASVSISTTAGGEEGQASAGTYPISISVSPSEAGDNYNFNVQNATLNIEKAVQTITLSTIEDKEPTDAAFDVTASVDSDLSLTFEVSGPASISGTTVTLDGTEGTVTVTVSQEGDGNHNEASVSEAFEVAVVLAIGDELRGVKIYPNPVFDHLVVESDQKVSIRFYTLDGKLMKAFSNVTGQVNVQDLKAGTYLIEITTKDSKKFERIIKAN